MRTVHLIIRVHLWPQKIFRPGWREGNPDPGLQSIVYVLMKRNTSDAMDYSNRSAVAGSTRDARRAGM
jgi:hypothetical protein